MWEREYYGGKTDRAYLSIIPELLTDQCADRLIRKLTVDVNIFAEGPQDVWSVERARRSRKAAEKGKEDEVYNKTGQLDTGAEYLHIWRMACGMREARNLHIPLGRRSQLLYDDRNGCFFVLRRGGEWVAAGAALIACGRGARGGCVPGSF